MCPGSPDAKALVFVQPAACTDVASRLGFKKGSSASDGRWRNSTKSVGATDSLKVKILGTTGAPSASKSGDQLFNRAPRQMPSWKMFAVPDLNGNDLKVQMIHLRTTRAAKAHVTAFTLLSGGLPQGTGRQDQSVHLVINHPVLIGFNVTTAH